MRTRPIRNSLAALLIGAATLVYGCGGGSEQEPLTLNLDTFASPDGNVGCIADEQMVRCDIALPDWKVVDRTGDCQLDYGQGISVGTEGKAEFVCAGDTTLGSHPVLPANKINMVGPFECQSNEAGDGIVCDNIHTGHGFELSTADFETY